MIISCLQSQEGQYFFNQKPFITPSTISYEIYYGKVSGCSLFYGMYIKVSNGCSRVKTMEGTIPSTKTAHNKYDPSIFKFFYINFIVYLREVVINMFPQGVQEGKSSSKMKLKNSWGFETLRRSNITRGLRRLILDTFKSFSRIISK